MPSDCGPLLNMSVAYTGNSVPQAGIRIRKGTKPLATRMRIVGLRTENVMPSFRLAQADALTAGRSRRFGCTNSRLIATPRYAMLCSRKLPDAPITSSRPPAIAGANTRAPDELMLLSATALTAISRGTRSSTRAWRRLRSNTPEMPLITVRTNRCQTCSASAAITAASRNPASALASCVAARSRLRS